MSAQDYFAQSRVTRLVRTFDGETRLRRRIVPQAKGVAVEFGFGTGRNLPFYDRARVRKLYAVNPPNGFADQSSDAIDGAGLTIVRLPVSAEALPLGDDIADTVVVTYGFCAIPDAEAAMAEARRVLKPGGRLLLVEHGRAPSRIVARLQDWLNPIWRRLAGGQNLNRDITAMLAQVGFDTSTVEQVYLRGLPRILGAHHLGVARRV